MQADVLLRGFSGWNTRRALELMQEMFPKVRKERGFVSLQMHLTITSVTWILLALKN